MISPTAAKEKVTCSHNLCGHEEIKEVSSELANSAALSAGEKKERNSVAGADLAGASTAG